MTYNRPAYVPASTTVNYSFDVFADGVWIDSDTGALTGNAARWQGFAKPGAKIELRNVVLTPLLFLSSMLMRMALLFRWMLPCPRLLMLVLSITRL